MSPVHGGPIGSTKIDVLEYLCHFCLKCFYLTLDETVFPKSEDMYMLSTNMSVCAPTTSLLFIAFEYQQLRGELTIPIARNPHQLHSTLL